MTLRLRKGSTREKNQSFVRQSKPFILGLLCSALALGGGLAIANTHSKEVTSDTGLRFIQIAAKNKEERSAVAQTGVSIEAVRSDSVWVFANSKQISRLKERGFHVLGNFDYKTSRGGHETLFDFPSGDSKFHNYDRMTQELHALQSENPDLVSLTSIGKSLEGRNIWAIHFNTSKDALSQNVSNKPGIVYMGNHHAREHVSLEIPLMLAKHLVDHKNDPQIAQLLENRDVWIIPMVNPDGAEFDISTGSYQWWRKNRRPNGDGTFGVDLNRNYSYEWGTGGSETDTSSETYLGTNPFSEPETQAVRDFVRGHLNLKVLLSFHTFSELILYPWGYTYDGISKTKDQETYKRMATTMAQWNHYTPQQSSALYIASGDTTDWSYGELGIFSFTFELSPSGMEGGGFYPGQKVIDKVFKDNLQPCLYLLQVAGNPYQVLDSGTENTWLSNYVQPGSFAQ